VREVQEFRATLGDLGKVAEVLILPHADHGFAIPNSSAYNEKAANEAWETTLTFLERNLKLATPTRAQ
jgi:carboxymethylenebutenolidase